MKSGLYALAGASATATAAAWANRLLAPMTKVSKVYLGFSRVSSTCSGTCWPGRGRRAPGTSTSGGGPVGSGREGVGGTVVATVELVLAEVELVDLLASVGGAGVVALVERVGLGGGRLDERGVDRDGQAEVAAELGAQGRGDPVTQPGLDDVLGEVVRDGDERGVVEQADEPGEREEGPLLHRDPVGVQDLQGRPPELGHRRVRHWSSSPSFRPLGPSCAAGPGDRSSSTSLSTGCGDREAGRHRCVVPGAGGCSVGS